MADAAALSKFDWWMPDDVRNEKVEQNIFADLQPLNDVKHLLRQPATVHVTVIPVKTTAVTVQDRQVLPEAKYCPWVAAELCT